MCWRGHPTGLWGHIKVKLASRCCRPGGGDPGSGGGTRGGGGFMPACGRTVLPVPHACLFSRPCRGVPPKSHPCVVSQTNAVPTVAFVSSNQPYMNPIPRKQRHLCPAKGYCLMSGGHVGPILSQSASPQPHVSFEAGA